MAAIKYKLRPTDRIVYRDKEFAFSGHSDTGYILRSVDGPNREEHFSWEKFSRLFSDPDFIYTADYYHGGVRAACETANVQYISDLDKLEQECILRKQDYCTSFLEKEAAGLFTRSHDSLKKAVAQIYAELLNRKEAAANSRCTDEVRMFRKPAPRTLLKWIKRFEEGGLRAIALRSRHHKSGNYTRRLDAPTEAIIESYAQQYAAENRPSKKQVHMKMLAEWEALGHQGKPPSLKTLCRRIANISSFDVYAGRFGKTAAIRKFSAVCGGIDVIRPLERVEMDEYQVPLQVFYSNKETFENLSEFDKKRIKRGRIYVCLAICCATRCILGISFSETPTAANALAALRMSLCEKDNVCKAFQTNTPWNMFGTPELIVTDQGSSYVSAEFKGAVTDLRIDLMHPPAGKPQLRARVERVFKTMETHLISQFSGRSFANVTERGDYPSVERASLTIDALAEVTVRWIVDYYHNQPHVGLGGRTPRQAWDQLMNAHGEINPPPDRHARIAVFGNNVERILDSRGVRLAGLLYQSAKLQAFRRTNGDHRATTVKVKVRYDSQDLGMISVLLGSEWVAIPCMAPEAQGISIWALKAASKNERERGRQDQALSLPAVLAAVRAFDQTSRSALATAGLVTSLTQDEKDWACNEATMNFSGDTVGVDIGEDDLFSDSVPLKPGSGEIDRSDGDDDLFSGDWGVKT